MNNHQLESILHPILGDAFGGVWPSDVLPERPKHRPMFYVFNNHPQNREGEHWIGIVVEAEEGKVSFFDSYGYPPNFSYYPKEFMQFLSQNGHDIRYNTKQVQDSLSSTCGAHVIFFLCHRFKGLSFQETMRLFSDNLQKNDELVTKFVKKYRKCISRPNVGKTATQNACSLKLFNDCHNCLK